MATPSNPSLALTKFDRRLPLADFKSETMRDRIFNPALGQHAVADRALQLANYAAAFEHWIESLRRLPHTVLIADFVVEDRMVVGIGAPSVLQNSITLHRLWGTPYIPGSAIKGVLNHYLHRYLTEAEFEDLFGTTAISGSVDFLDAWWVPNTPKHKNPLELDVVNVHHSKYYGSGGTHLATDFDDPTPSFFVTSRGTYAVPIHAASEEWAEYLMAAVAHALQERGVGAKTNANYGFLKCTGWRIGPTATSTEGDSPIDPVNSDENPPPDSALPEIPDPKNKLEVQRYLREWEALPDEETRKESGLAFWERVHAAPRALYDLTGETAPGFKAPKNGIGQPKSYMIPFIEWIQKLEEEN